MQHGGFLSSLLSPTVHPGSVLARDKFNAAQTEAERKRTALQAAGDARGRIVAKMGEIAAAGGDMGVLMNDPDMLEAISTPGVNIQSLMAMGIEAKDAARRKLRNVGAGVDVMDEATGELVFSNEAAPKAKTASEVSVAAIDRLQKLGVIDEERALKMKARALKVTPIINRFGDNVGSGVVDLTDKRKKNPQKPQPGQPGFVPGFTPDPDGEPSAAPGMSLGRLKDPTDVFNAGGFVGFFTELFGGLTGQAFPALSGESITKSRNAVKQTRFYVQQLGNATKLKIVQEKIEELMPGLSVLRNSLQLATTYIDLHNFSTTLLEQMRAARVDPKASRKVKIEADVTILALNNLLATMPSLEAMLDREAKLKAGVGGQITIGKGLQVFMETAKGLTNMGPITPEKISKLSRKGLTELADQIEQDGVQNEITPEQAEAFRARIAELKNEGLRRGLLSKP